MLEQLRQQSRSFIIWILFAIIILAFVFTFGTQGGLELNCGATGSAWVMKIDDEEVSETSLRFGLQGLSGGRMTRAQRAQLVMDQLLARELLAQAADKAGFVVTEEMVNKHIKRGDIWILGNAVDGKQAYFREVGDKQFFDYDALTRIAGQWGLSSVDAFIIQQRREILAELMRGLIQSGGTATEDEARARFLFSGDTVTVDAVRFRPLDYRTRMVLTDAEVERYLASHGDEVRARFDQDERLYKDRGAEVKVSQIMFTRTPKPPAKPAGDKPADDAKPGDKPADDATKPAGDSAGGGDAEAPDPKLVAAREAHAKLAQGADFGQLATEVSEDKRSARRGGDLGWKSAKTPGLGGKELADALAELKVGEHSDVLETSRGYYILRVEDKREGDLTYDQVKHEIAGRLALEYYAKEGARSAAQAALDEAKSGKKLEDMFEKSAPPMNLPPGGLPPGMTQEDYLRLMQQLQQGGGPALPGEQGSVLWQSADRPVESVWLAQAPAQPEAKPAAEPAAEGEKPVESGSSDAAAAPASGGPEIPATIEEVPKPKLLHVGPLTRDADGELAAIGKSKDLMDILFDKLAKDEFGPEVYEVSGDFVIVQVVERQKPEMDKFDDDERASAIRSIARQRGVSGYMEWITNRCKSLVDAKELEINYGNPLLNDLSSDTKEPFRYSPCQRLF